MQELKGLKKLIMNGNLETIAENTQQVKQAEDDTKNSSDALSGALQQVGAAMQVAFGLGVYQIVSAIVNQFKEAITYGLQFSQAMYELNTGVNELRACSTHSCRSLPKRYGRSCRDLRPTANR